MANVVKGRTRVFIESVTPRVDDGEYPIKRIVGDRVHVGVDLVADGHDVVTGDLLFRKRGSRTWQRVRLADPDNDRYFASFQVPSIGFWEFTIEAWVDHFATERRGLLRKAEVGESVGLELLEIAKLVEQAAERGSKSSNASLESLAQQLADATATESERVALAAGAELDQLMTLHPDRGFAARYQRTLSVYADRALAQFSAWYEMFPRSTGGPGQHGTFQTARAMLPYIAEMGFDIVYLPPIHPIGNAFRKGKNNTLTPAPDDVGSPWAIGAKAGGHKSVHPELGTLDDFRGFRAAAEQHGLEVALDIALQVSPDHPYVKQHPEWFKHRADGSIQYAENPPKKYQDIYPFWFETDQWKELWQELASIFFFWIEQGVKVFRVDNPHTKSLAFWQWAIGEITAKHPDVLFLAEAFTRPKLMQLLAKAGFTQSYTYFTWRVSKWELTEYMKELTGQPLADFFRPNFWPNTPDILPRHLQHAPRSAFEIRLILAAMLSSNFGIYGPAFELMDNVPREGAEEYIDNEKYELKVWDLERLSSLRFVIKKLNEARRNNPALQSNASLQFHGTDNDQLVLFSKADAASGNRVLVAVNLDPHHVQSGWTDVNLAALGLGHDEPFQVRDALADGIYTWQGPRNFIQLDPNRAAGHVFVVEPPGPAP